MKTIKLILGLCLVLAITGSAASHFTPYPRIWIQTCGLNLGLIPLKDADWGFLKLRSGQAGLDALRDLERHGATDKIRQTSAAVEEQWLEAGHESGGGHIIWVQEKETRFSDLWMPVDSKILPKNLVTGQTIPESFWRDQQFRAGCVMPPKSLDPGRSDSCVIRMFDMTEDSQPEIIVDHTVTESGEFYASATTREEWEIYALKDNEWQRATRLRFCDLPQSRFISASMVSTPLDMILLNNKAVNFFDPDCYPENVTFDPKVQALQAARMAEKITLVPTLFTNGHKVPQSLIEALRIKAVIAPDLYRPIHKPLGDEKPDTRPRFVGMPPCFVDSDPKACVVVMVDIDHDGTDEVIVIDRLVHPDGKPYRIATLLMFRDQHWQIMSNHAICAPEGEDVNASKVSIARNQWRPVAYSGRLYLPPDLTDECSFHMLMM